jgi:hypothetical protein
VKEVKEARKLLDEGILTRLMIDRGPMKHERTLLFTLEGDWVFLLYFDHEPGLGDVAVQILSEIRNSF